MNTKVKEIMLFVILPLILTSTSLAIIGGHSTFQTNTKIIKMKRESDSTTICFNESCYDDLILDDIGMKV